MIFVPIGSDCGACDLLNKYTLRKCAFPFDWIVTYRGVSDIIKNKFDEFVPPTRGKFNDNYGIHFFHDLFPQDIDKYKRRIARWNNLLNGDEEIIFFKKGHSYLLHSEYENILNDITDCINLNLLLKNYPKLNYSFYVLLTCGKCFSPEKTYETEFDNIKIYNMSNTLEKYPYDTVEKAFLQMFSVWLENDKSG